MSSKTAELKQKTVLTTENIIFAGLCALLFLAPFFRGLFFETELLPAHIFSFALALVWMIYKYKDKSYKLIKTPIDMLAIGVVFMYFISIIYGVNTRLALAEFLKYANYFVIFLLARDLATDEKRKRWLLNTIIISGVGVSLVGIGTAIGTWSYNGAFVSNRINSTFQYPNTLASYLGALFILAIGLLVSEERKHVKALYSACSSIMLFTFILTYSRGMWLILPFVLLLFIIFMPNKRKFETVIYLIINAVASIPLAFLFSQKLEGSSTTLWMIVIVSAIATGALTYAISLIQNRLRNVSIKKLIVAFFIIFIICGVLISYAVNSTTSLTLSNTGTEDKWTVIFRNVERILPNTEYELVVKYSGENNKEKPNIGRVRVYSVYTENDAEKLERLEFVDIVDTHNSELSIPFITFENTEAIKVFFDNYYTDTTITFDEAKLIKKQTNEIIKDIPLKYKYIPESMVTRFESISLKENSAQARIAFYRDSFKVIKDYPILGTGGGGWVTLYQMYQSYLYWTKLAHNYFLQMWVEVGIVGLGIFVSLVLGLMYIFYKKYRKIENESDRIVLAATTIAVLAILAHAFMDFDLSLSALTFVLWMLMGMLYSGYSTDKCTNTSKSKKIRQNRSMYNVIVAVIMIVLIIGSSSLLLASKNAEKGLAASKEQKIDEAINYFEKASKFDPYKAEYKTDLSTFYKLKYQLTQDKEYIKKSIDLTENAVKLAPYSSQLNFIASSTYMSIGKIDKALDLVEKSIELQPMRVENYLQKCNAYLAAFNYYISQKKDFDKAEEIIEEAYKVKEQIKNVNDVALKPLKYNEDLLYKIGFIQFNYENLKSREYKAGRDYVLDFAYYFDLDINEDEKIDKLRVANSKNGNVQYEVIDNNGSFIRITNDGESYGFVYPYGLKLEPDTEYDIYFKARGNIKDTTFNFYVYDSKAENKVQGILKGVKLSDDWQIYKLNIKTDSDIKPGTQYLRFQHNGKDSGYIDVEEAMMFKKIK